MGEQKGKATDTTVAGNKNSQPNNTTAGAALQWESPAPLKIATLPPFPVDSLPSVLRHYALALSEATQTPIDMAAVRSLSVCSICAQGKFIIRPKADWREPLHLYALTIAPPAERKSAVDSACVEPIKEYEKEWNRKNRDAIERSEMDIKLKENEIQKALKKGGVESGNNHELYSARRELNKLIETAVKPLRLFCDNVTPEALASLMADNKGKMAVVSSEGGIFGIMAGLYSDKVNIDVFLKSHPGEEIRIDRISRPPEYIPSPCLTLALSAQPQVLDEISSQPELSGRGLLGRFLYSVPASNLGRRRYETEPIPPRVSEEYRRLVHDLLEIEQPENPRILTLSEGAYIASKKFFDELEPLHLEEFYTMQPWSGKLHGSVTMRISGILHICNHRGAAADVPVSAETVNEAIKISDYFTKHAQRVFDKIGIDKDADDAQYVLGKILERRFGQFTLADLKKACRRFKKNDELSKPLGLLEKHGYVKVSGSHVAGNKTPVRIYAVNPRIFHS